MCFRKKSCCCGSMDVEKGSRVIAILGMVFAAALFVGAVVKMDFGNAFGQVIGFAISYMLYYGIKERKTAFIMCWLVLEMIGLVGLVIITVLIIALVAIFADNWDEFVREYPQYFEGYEQQDLDAIAASCGVVAIVCIVIFVIAIVLNAYFFAVVYSCHKNIQEEMYGDGVNMQTIRAETGHGYSTKGDVPPALQNPAQYPTQQQQYPAQYPTQQPQYPAAGYDYGNPPPYKS